MYVLLEPVPVLQKWELGTLISLLRIYIKKLYIKIIYQKRSGWVPKVYLGPHETSIMKCFYENT